MYCLAFTGYHALEVAEWYRQHWYDEQTDPRLVPNCAVDLLGHQSRCCG